MRIRGVKRIGAGAMGAGLLLLPALAAAAAEDGAKIEEIVVTAQKRAESAQDVGITLNAFSARIANKGVMTTEDLALYTPGLTVNETAATGAAVHDPRRGLQDY
jgi:iron complex outermembrane receptor protein